MSSDVTYLLEAVREGEAGASRQLYEQVYGELRRLAGARMRRERPGHTLQPTEVVHEAWMRLVQGEPRWESRAHFFGAAAEGMRRILVEHARKRGAAKRGGDMNRVTFNEMNVAADDPDIDIVAMDGALEALEAHNAHLASVVKLRYFAGMTVEETAEVLGESASTVKRNWTYARAWLFERMSA
ncbi:MAG: sigma-70 family RNA polymerase sigma factor [Deltaproteobacteria bacterium]|jgi:RNA polymerase sigma factor (TIGR02999 family)